LTEDELVAINSLQDFQKNIENNPSAKAAKSRLFDTDRTVHGALVDSQLLGDALIVIESALYPRDQKLNKEQKNTRAPDVSPEMTKGFIDSIAPGQEESLLSFVKNKQGVPPYSTSSLFTPIVSTDYSTSGAFGSPEDYIRLVAENAKKSGEENPSVVLADDFSTAGKVDFLKACKKYNVNPILGMQVRLQGKNGQDSNLTLIARDKKGFENLNRLGSAAFTTDANNDYRKISKETLMSYSEGLSAITNDPNGYIESAIISGDMNKAKAIAKTFVDIFGDNFYLGVSRVADTQNKLIEEEKIISGMKEISNELNVPLFATNSIMFPSREQYDSSIALQRSLDKTYIYQPHLEEKISEHQYLPTTMEMYAKFSDMPQAVLNTSELLKGVSLELELGRPQLPDFPIPREFKNEMDYLSHLTQQGFEKRWVVVEEHLQSLKSNGKKYKGSEITDDYISTLKKEYEDRFDYELSVIKETGFPGYFLITHDFIDWSKKNDIPVGPGRGSGAGSLVLYNLGVTDIDPMERDLLFERFLNPERIGMPDVDIDLSPSNRGRVIDYLREKFGSSRVAQIQTYGTLAAKAAVDTAGRILNLRPIERDRLKNLVDDAPGVKLSEEIENNEGLKSLMDTAPMAKKVMETAKSLEGSVVSFGKHAGGVIIAPSGVESYAPLYRAEDDQGSPTIQHEKNDTESLGPVKFDLLGLKNLDIIQKANKFIGKTTDDMMRDRVWEDEAAINQFRKADTFGVFQFESPGMRRLMSELRPDNFDEVVALVALFRPGPLQSGMASAFVDIKHGKKEISYPHPDLKELLEPTYGTIIYQEQVMGIARQLAGYSLGQADILRKAMGKKDPVVMEAQRKMFVDGAQKKFAPLIESKTGVSMDLQSIEVDGIKKYVSESGYISEPVSLINLLKDYQVLPVDELEILENKLQGNKESSDDKNFGKSEFWESYHKKITENLTNSLQVKDKLDKESASQITKSVLYNALNLAEYNSIFNLMAEFAAYGFNKSHSEAYAMVAMQTAYLKAHYPAQYMSSVISLDKDLETVAKTALEINRMGLKILPPDINKSNWDFEAVSPSGKETEIRYGFGQVKGIPEPLRHILKMRDSGGAFESLDDFFNRTLGEKMMSVSNTTGKEIKKTLLTLSNMKNIVNSGILDSLGPTGEYVDRKLMLDAFKTRDSLMDSGVKSNETLTKLLDNLYILQTSKLEDLTDDFIKESADFYRANMDSLAGKKAVKDTINNGYKHLFGSVEKPTLQNIKNYRELDSDEDLIFSELEFELTGMYHGSHYLDRTGIRSVFEKSGFASPLNTLSDKIALQSEKDGKERGKEYVKDTKASGMIVEKKVFYGWSERHSDFRTSVRLLVEDGSGGVADVKFDAEDIFPANKIDSSLKKLEEGKAFAFTGSACRGNYDSAPNVIYASDVHSPDEFKSNVYGINFSKVNGKSRGKNKGYDKSQSKPKKDFPASDPQKNFVKSIMKRKGISVEQFLEDASSKYGIECKDINEMSSFLARAFLDEHVQKQKNKVS